MRKLIGFVFLLLTACRQEVAVEKSSRYFELPAFAQAEADRLRKMEVIPQRFWSLGQEKEVKSDSSGWLNSLADLSKYDLNKNAYQGRYRVDSLQLVDTLLIRYQAEDVSMKPASLHLYWLSGQLVLLECQEISDNLLYKAALQYRYEPGRRMEITGSQQLRWGNPHHFQMGWSL
jgi:hypothetical protein